MAKQTAVAEATSLQDVRVTMTMELGRTQETLDQLLQFSGGTVFELDRMVDEPIDLYLNGRFYGRGVVVTVAENFGVRITEIAQQVDSRDGGDQP